MVNQKNPNKKKNLHPKTEIPRRLGVYSRDP